MDIIIENLQTRVPLSITRAKMIIQKVIKKEKLRVSTLSFSFVSRQKIKQLNKKFLKREYTTDVLAFDLRNSGQCSVDSGQKNGKSYHPLNTDHCSLTTKEISGDIIVSTDAALGQAKEYGTTVAYELVLYMVHGLLHLLGYDDHAPQDIKRMRQKETQVMSYLKKIYPKVVSP